MLLIKCKCGCHFTAKSLANLRSKSSMGTTDWTCQNCNTYGYFTNAYDALETYDKISESGFTICNLPDNASIEIKYNV